MQKRINFSPIATSIEQSKRLLAAGLDPGSADMCYANVEFNPNYLPDIRLSVISYAQCVETYKAVGLIAEGIVPAWSLSRLIDIHGDFNYGPMNNGSEKVMDCIVESIIVNIEYNSGRINEKYLKK